MRPYEAQNHEDENTDDGTVPPQHKALQTLHNDLQSLARHQLRRAQFELRWPATHITQWQSWQHTAQDDASALLDLSCLLAYYAVDYETNVVRLTQSHKRLREKREFPDTAETNHYLCCLLDRISVVYRRQRDSTLLLLLLEMQFPFFRSRRAQWEIIARLWDQHRLALLKAASLSPLAQRTLLHALIYTCRTVEERTLWIAYYRHLQSATYLRDRQLTRTALRLIAGLRRAERRHELE